jgi:hypothetical protein
MYGVTEVDTGVWFGYMKETDCLEDLDIDGKVLTWSMHGGHGLGMNLLCFITLIS